MPLVRELGEDLRRLGLSEADIRLMPYEFFNPYSRERKLLSFDALDFSAFFESTQALHFFCPGEKLCRESFRGIFGFI